MSLRLTDIFQITNIWVGILPFRKNILKTYCSITSDNMFFVYLSCIHRASPPPLPLADNHLPFGSIAISAKNGLFL